jgi:phospholipase/carboxylesterase
MTMKSISTPGPHAGGKILTRGNLETAAGAAILLHGRGATADSILTLADEIAIASVAYLAPQAAGRSWYPYRFLEPLARNEPWLSAALSVVEDIVVTLLARGFAAERVALLGFSQGACLSLESGVRHPRRYGGIVALSGGLIGPPGTDWPSSSMLAGTPVFLGCGDRDDHIPVSRVRESEQVYVRAGARVSAVIYPGMPHIVNEDELEHVRGIFADLTK